MAARRRVANVTLDRFMPELDALTRPELVQGYSQIERARSWREGRVRIVESPEGARVKVSVYEGSRLVSTSWREPVSAPGSRTSKAVQAVSATRLA